MVVGDCDGLQVELARLHRVVAELRVRGIHDQALLLFMFEMMYAIS